MRWKTKSLIQRACALLPLYHEPAYYTLQRAFGRMRYAPDPTEYFEACATVVRALHDLNVKVSGARVMEIGTGWGLDMPLGLFLCGVSSIKTYDLHRYLKPKRVLETVHVILKNRDRLKQIFLPVVESASTSETRLEALCAVTTIEQLFRVTGIEYYAPGDAANTGLPNDSIDIQISRTVFEHIPEPVLAAIIQEASRVLSWEGVAVHLIDLSDHFSHDDLTIAPINFLQFSDEEWRTYAGNQFAYHNRLRATDVRRLFEDNGHRILHWRTHCDDRSVRLLRDGFSLDAKFRGYPESVLCTTGIHSISTPIRNGEAPPKSVQRARLAEDRM